MSKADEFQKAVEAELSKIGGIADEQSGMEEDHPLLGAFGHASGIISGKLSLQTHISSGDIKDACKYIKVEHTQKAVEKKLTAIIRQCGLSSGG